MTYEKCVEQIMECTMCGLCRGIKHKVPGQGDIHSPLMLIGEGPGQTEDETGVAFCGAAGELLTKMLAAISLPRDRVYICNVVKCHPPENRNPQHDEAQTCIMHLRNQVGIIRPKVILLLGSVALTETMGTEHRITRDRGKWIESKGVLMLPTYHPAALLRDPGKKRDAWADMQSLRDKLMELGLFPDIYGGRNAAL